MPCKQELQLAGNGARLLAKMRSLEQARDMLSRPAAVQRHHVANDSPVRWTATS